MNAALLAIVLATRAFVPEVKDEATFRALSREVESDRLGKFLIDLSTDAIYYFDVNLYRIHRDFVQGQILRREMTPEERVEYNRNYHAHKPRFILGYLTLHRKTGVWTFGFWEGDQIVARDVRRVKAKLEKTFFKKDLLFRPDSERQEQMLAELADLPAITNDKLYKSADYQAFNEGRAIGILCVVPPGTPFERLVFAKDEIVLLQDSYPDLVPVSGVLSTTFSTPLSHVNLRAKAWGIPNAGLRDAARRYASLHRKVVVFEVGAVEHVLREATQAEIAAWKAARQAERTVRVPPADLGPTELRSLKALKRADARVYGAKAANLGEIAGAGLRLVYVPAGFAVPFSAYAAHMKRHGLDAVIERTLAEPTRARLADLRDRIMAAELDPALLDAVAGRVERELRGRGVFVRSSTNAEDLEGFNGAGLYDTVPNVKGREALGRAIKQVWASLWSPLAVKERAFFGIDQRAVQAGALIQVGVNASAAGVLVTRNLFDAEDDHSFTINAKRGLGIKVVAGTTIPEQVVYDVKYPGTRIVSRSDDPTMLVFDEAGGVKEVPNPDPSVILTESRAKALARAVVRFQPLFPGVPLDVECVLEGERIWIVQARPFVTK